MGELVGERLVGQLNLLDGSCPALLDTGSMISIIPIEVLAQAKERGYDVDALQLIENSQLRPVLMHS
ncbi:unnamed protein product [Nippostrongylus brasiliensis]|uniref:Peptidase A2 domain-containing protein n=1 Tax=Nippostrongylus brasiliensis TaxID=27835 RepID=A0A0N4YTM0_NIPBR|nr:unnamed protein product [Nippostrongylus brasiliensis]